jgi:hypothetical protein
MRVGQQRDAASELDLHRLGLGTWQNTDPDQCAESVRTALEPIRRDKMGRRFGTDSARRHATMVDTLELYALHDQPFDTEARIAVYERLHSCDGFECTVSPAEIRGRLAADGTVVLTATYRSVHLTLVFGGSVPGLPDFPQFVVSIEGTEFDHPSVTLDERDDRIDDLLRFVRRWYRRSGAAGHPPRYVIGAAPTHVDHLRRETGFLRTTTDGVRTGELEELYWVQLLPSSFVDSVGRDRIRRSPAPRFEALDDGSVCFTAHEHPLEFAADYRDMLAHFDLDRA